MRRRFFLLDVINTDVFLLVLIALLKSVTHLLSNQNYGFHRDELLYLAMGDHLGAGYFEVPPFIAYVAALTGSAHGPGLATTRLVPALCGGMIVFLTGKLTQKLGGDRFAAVLAMLAVFIGPVYLRAHTLFQPVVLDQFFWLICIYLLVKIVRDESSGRSWLLLGLAFGLGVLAKYSILILAAGAFTGIMLTPFRRRLLCYHPWLAVLITLLIALPNLLWQIQHGWPIFHHIDMLYDYQLVHLNRVDFLREQMLMLHPATLYIWLAGLAFLFLGRAGRTYILIGWVYLTCLLVLLLFNGKAYYLAPVYPALFAAGGVAVSRFIRSRRWAALKPALIMLLILNGIALAPYGIPCLPVNYMVDYMAFMSERFGLSGPLRTEAGIMEEMPQDYVDMFGWPEQVAVAASVFNTLTEADREACVIITGNYGEAGAIDLFGPAYGLPRALTSGSSYYYWGPGTKPGTVAIAYGHSREVLERFYRSVEERARIDHPHAIHYEQNLPVYLCRDPYRTLQDVWPELRPF